MGEPLHAAPTRGVDASAWFAEENARAPAFFTNVNHAWSRFVHARARSHGLRAYNERGKEATDYYTSQVLPQPRAYHTATFVDCWPPLLPPDPDDEGGGGGGGGSGGDNDNREPGQVTALSDVRTCSGGEEQQDVEVGRRPRLEMQRRVVMAARSRHRPNGAGR